MKAMLHLFGILIVFSIATSPAQVSEDGARIRDDMHANFQCALRAEVAEMPAEEQLRLFELGYDLALEWVQPFLEGTERVPADVAPSDDLKSVAITMGLVGPRIGA